MWYVKGQKSDKINMISVWLRLTDLLVAHWPWASIIFTFIDFCISITKLYSDIALQFILETNSLEIRRSRSAKLSITWNISRNRIKYEFITVHVKGTKIQHMMNRWHQHQYYLHAWDCFDNSRFPMGHVSNGTCTFQKEYLLRTYT